MRLLYLLILVVSTGNLSAQTIIPPLEQRQLTIHTLVREDVFAGWQDNDMERFARAESNIETLLEQRPESKAELLAWKGGTVVFRAVLAYEAGETGQFEELYQQALQLFDESRQLDRENIGVSAVCGGSLLTFADRLPEEVRGDAWSDAWNDYQVIWKQQGPAVDRMPLHITGELLAGMAQTAQRTGRDKEMDQYLDKIIKSIPKSAYAREARKWKDDPQYAAVGNLGCKSCHAPGRLSVRLKEIDGN